MPDFTRPGPPTIQPATLPGGVVIHVYAVPTGRLLIERFAVSIAEVDAIAGPDADHSFADLRHDEHAVCLVAYDGDTGQRFTADDWTAE